MRANYTITGGKFMKAFLQTTLLVSSLFSLSSFAKMNNCRELKNDVISFCQNLEDSCTSIKSCLTRRDTCVGTVPKNVPKDAEGCLGLNECMGEVAGRLPSSDRCEYYWNQSGDSNGFCTVKKHWLYSEDGCPGKIGGLLNTIAYGLIAEVDMKFDCKPTYVKYKKKARSCASAIKDFSAHCKVEQNGHSVLAPSDVSFVKQYMPKTCEYRQNFKKYHQGDFELAPEAETHNARTNDGRRSIKKVAPQTDDRSPVKGGNAIKN